MKTIIHADHPIFKRIDKIVSDELEVAELVGELMKLGYENIVVKPFNGCDGCPGPDDVSCKINHKCCS